MSEQPIVVFTDGASKGNPGPGGWGVIILTPDGHVTELGGGAPLTTNNKMELTGAIRAFEHLAATGGPVAIHTDSTYVIKGIREWVHGWKRRGWKTATGSDVLNRDLWERLDGLTSARGPRTIAWHYVRGHVGIPGNERVDRIADAFAMHTPVALYDGPARRLRRRDPRSTRQHGRAGEEHVLLWREQDEERCLLVPQRRRWQADAPYHVVRVRAARQGTFGRTVQEGDERGRSRRDPSRLALQARGRVAQSNCAATVSRFTTRSRAPAQTDIASKTATRMKSRGFIGPSPVTT